MSHTRTEYGRAGQGSAAPERSRIVGASRFVHKMHKNAQEVRKMGDGFFGIVFFPFLINLFFLINMAYDVVSV